MTEKTKKGGAGKFFLGAALGAAAAAVAAKFISGKKKSCDCGKDCKCDKTDCKCDKKAKTTKTAKKTTKSAK